MDKVVDIRQKNSTRSSGFAESTGSHGFHGSTLVYTKNSWRFWVQFAMLGVAVAAGIWIKYWLIVGFGFAGILWLGGGRLSMPYNTIQITEDKIVLLRKRHIYREYLFYAKGKITLNISRHSREYIHYYRLAMRLHHTQRGVECGQWYGQSREQKRGQRYTVIRFKHFVSRGYQRLQEEVQEIKTFLETRATQRVEVKESFSLL